MKVKVLISLGFGLYGGMNLLACADEIINQPHVPINVQKHFFKGEEEIQITSPGLHIVDLRDQESINQRTIFVSPAMRPTTTNTFIQIPQTSCFQSNISPTAHHALPPGQNSRILNGTNILKPGELLGQKLQSPKNKNIALVTPETSILNYNNVDSGSTTGKVFTINTEVKGILKSKPGHLLSNH